ncbi:MAG: hypothetical protein BWY99_02327 [Synergistetes bacterium ADurb.BinA166]|nr:MAG: hypothetical protein BWY99_02327 [Synergistetes bacterium ADurb.BinA166]
MGQHGEGLEGHAVRLLVEAIENAEADPVNTRLERSRLGRYPPVEVLLGPTRVLAGVDLAIVGFLEDAELQGVLRRELAAKGPEAFGRERRDIEDDFVVVVAGKVLEVGDELREGEPHGVLARKEADLAQRPPGKEGLHILAELLQAEEAPARPGFATVSTVAAGVHAVVVDVDHPIELDALALDPLVDRRRDFKDLFRPIRAGGKQDRRLFEAEARSRAGNPEGCLAVGVPRGARSLEKPVERSQIIRERHRSLLRSQSAGRTRRRGSPSSPSVC